MFPDEEACWEALRRSRWPRGFGVVAHEPRAEAVLEEVSHPTVTCVEVSRVAGADPRHRARDRDASGPDDQMHVVRHQRPGVAVS